MLKKIENPTVATVDELRRIYADKWLYYVIVEEGEEHLYKPSNGLMAKAVFIGDSRNDLLTVSKTDEKQVLGDYIRSGHIWGINVDPEPGTQIGGIEVEWF